MSLLRASLSSSFRYPPRCLLPKYVRYVEHNSSHQSQKLPLSRLDIEQLKRPSRGGQNLSDRYLRLERSLRGKQALSNIIHDSEILDESHPGAGSSGSHDSANTSETFRGFTIPREPKPPESDGASIEFLLCLSVRRWLITWNEQSAACLDALFAFTIYTKNPGRRTKHPSRHFVLPSCLLTSRNRNGPCGYTLPLLALGLIRTRAPS